MFLVTLLMPNFLLYIEIDFLLEGWALVSPYTKLKIMKV